MDIGSTIFQNSTVLNCTIPGLAGGIVLFLYAFHKNYYKNNKYIIKFIVEIIGATLTATILTVHLSNQVLQIIAAFAVGLGWTRIIQILRNKVTRIIEVIIGTEEERR